jgi:GDP-4-dehydro-6-deoxy-D-mannose reductase
MRTLVTGADGFVGTHLCAHLRAAGDEVVEVHGPHGAHPSALRMDLTDEAQVRAAVEEARPEGVIHLAGFSSVGQSHQAPGLALAVNALGTTYLLAALRATCPDARVLLISSGEVYGPVAPGTRASEDAPLVPTSPYSASKVAAELVGQQFQRSYGLPVVIVRPFNHLGRGQSPTFAIPSFAAQVRAIRQGHAQPLLQVGNLEPVRDFSHVADVVEAYRLLLQRGQPGAAYNVCSGTGRTLRSVLEELLALAGVHASVVVDPARLRPADIPSLVGDASRLRALGWRPRRTVTDALREVLDETPSPAA